LQDCESNPLDDDYAKETAFTLEIRTVLARDKGYFPSQLDKFNLLNILIAIGEVLLPTSQGGIYMKRFIVILTALMVLTSGFAFAKDDVKVEAGVKMWYNEWKSEDPDPAAGGTLTLDAALLIGPAISVTLPSNLFFEASYLFSVTDYEKTEGTAKIEVERDDLDVAIGYMFIPEFGIFAGYRSTSMDLSVTGGGSGSFDLSGPVIGLRGNYSFNDMFGVYATAAYLMTESEWTDPTGSFTEDAPGTSFELGVKAMFSKQLSGTLGYKIESFEGDESKVEDTFSGVTLGVMYAF
jgi:hypothetical protein